MVLVAADAIEAHVFSIFHLVQEFIVEVMPLLRVEEMTRHINPYATIFLGEVIGEEAVWHQMEPIEIHDVTSSTSPDSAESPTDGAASTLANRGCLVKSKAAACVSAHMLSPLPARHH
jgi:hypothetical protein